MGDVDARDDPLAGKIAELYGQAGLKDPRMLRIALEKAGGDLVAARKLYEMSSYGEALVALYKKWGVPFDEEARSHLSAGELARLQGFEAKRAKEREKQSETSPTLPAGLDASKVAAAAQRAVALAARGHSTHHEIHEVSDRECASRDPKVEADLALLLAAATEAGRPRGDAAQTALGITSCRPQHTLSKYVDSCNGYLSKDATAAYVIGHAAFGDRQIRIRQRHPSSSETRNRAYGAPDSGSWLLFDMI